MATGAQRPKLLVVVGPTASGKSALAMRLAKELGGEIICADSLTVYKHMDIGTAKPTKADQKEIKHWGLDLVGPGQRFTAAQFKHNAQGWVADIQSRSKLPIVAGGTGLYVDSLIFDFSFGGSANPKQRRKLEKLTSDELQNLIKHKAYLMPSNTQNRRHLIRTIERKGKIDTQDESLASHIILVGLLPSDEKLKNRISLRVEEMFKGGLRQETERLLNEYGHESLLAKAKVAYGPVVEYLSKDIGQAQAKQKLKTAHWQYARRQKTWFKRNKFIHWFDSIDSAARYVQSQLNT